MAGLCEGGNEPSGSLRASNAEQSDGITVLRISTMPSLMLHPWLMRKTGFQRIPNLAGPVDNNDVTLQRNRNKTAGRIDGYSLMAADGDCHHLCKLMAPVRHRWSINDVIGGIRNTVMPSDCSPVRFGIRSSARIGVT
ncbi:hypothetical protein ANN_11592 [Periplaneta americana]|uniref:Uncharacterized protein n=1 Tax=Periplaneta americana TaxID=6978 RepID=A0ABQ8T5G2_PERAM|nr:hypothetical protein ANN_11592 [Periplaneta americana]